MLSAELAELCKALGADVLALEDCDSACISAERTRGCVLLENDLIVLYIDLKAVLDTDVKSSSQLDRDNDSAEFVHFSYNSC